MGSRPRHRTIATLNYFLLWRSQRCMHYEYDVWLLAWHVIFRVLRELFGGILNRMWPTRTRSFRKWKGKKWNTEVWDYFRYAIKNINANLMQWLGFTYTQPLLIKISVLYFLCYGVPIFMFNIKINTFRVWTCKFKNSSWIRDVL